MENTEFEKIEKEKSSSWGGKREGSGRKPMLAPEELVRVKELIGQHGSELDKQKKKERCLVLLDVLYQEGVSKRNILAIKEYLDRQLGKSKQSVDLKGNLSIVGNQVALKDYGEDSETGSE